MMVKIVLFIIAMVLIPIFSSRGITKLTYGLFSMENLKVGAFASGYKKNIFKKILVVALVISCLIAIVLTK